jgi:hypothetical protein
VTRLKFKYKHDLIKRFLAFLEKLPVAPCLFLHNATCEAAMNYTKKKNVFRLHLKDGSEYLFEANENRRYFGGKVTRLKFKYKHDLIKRDYNTCTSTLCVML